MVNIAQFDGLACKHPQCPVVVTCGRGAASDGDEMRLLRAGERLVASLLPLVGQYRLDATRCEAGADVFDGIAADAEGLADRRIAPALAELQQDLRAGPGAGAVVAAMHVHMQPLAIAFGQRDGRRRR